MSTFSPALIIVLVILAVWEVIWKGFALWRSAQNKDTAWFVAVLIINSAGILPILYLLTHKSTD